MRWFWKIPSTWTTTRTRRYIFRQWLATTIGVQAEMPRLCMGDETCSPGAETRRSDEVTGEVDNEESLQKIFPKGSGSDRKKTSSEEEVSGEEKLTDEELGKRALDLLLEESPPMDGPARAIPSTPSDNITGDEKEPPARLHTLRWMRTETLCLDFGETLDPHRRP